MSWSTDDGKHEGYAASLLSDGRWAASYTGAGVIPDGAPDEIVPDDQVVGWRARCDCDRGNWEGSDWVRVASPAETDLAARRAYSEDAFAPQAVEDAIYAEWWKLHAGPQDKLAAVTEAADAARLAESLAARHLNDAVSAARDAGVSWDDVARAAGMSRESAHERWGQRVNGRCSWCGDPMQVPARPQGGGRTKLYCSPAHKQAAHRAGDLLPKTS